MGLTTSTDGLGQSGAGHAKLLVWEVLRAYPPVFGVPYYANAASDGTLALGHKVVPNAGWALHDPRKVGQEANKFVFNRPNHYPVGATATGTNPWAGRHGLGIWGASGGSSDSTGSSSSTGVTGTPAGVLTATDSLAWYESISMGWADAATPQYPHHDEHDPSPDTRACPAKRLSFAMAQAFLEALAQLGALHDAETGWGVVGGRDAVQQPTINTGSAWSSFELQHGQMGRQWQRRSLREQGFGR